MSGRKIQLIWRLWTIKRCASCVFLSLDLCPHTLGRGSPLRAQCGLFQHLSGNATITDHRPSKTRVALGLEGDKQPSTPSQSTDPSHNLHYWERKYYQLPTNKHLPISRGGIAFFSSCERKKERKKTKHFGHRHQRSGKQRWGRVHPCPLCAVSFLHPVSLTSLSCLSLATGSCPATHLTPHQATLMEPKSCL